MCCFTIWTVKQHIEENVLERKVPLRIGTKMHSQFWKLHFAIANFFVYSGACISLMRKQYRLGIQLELNSRHPSSFFVALC